MTACSWISGKVAPREIGPHLKISENLNPWDSECPTQGSRVLP